MISATAPVRRRLPRWPLVAFLVVGVAAGGWYLAARSAAGAKPPHDAKPGPGAAPAAVTVETVRPKPGGLPRVCVQPGTLEPFEAADLYAKVSGFLAEQTVDIGSRVKAGQVLARIAVPEAEKQVQRDAADVKRAEARVRQMTAGIATAEADLKAAASQVALAQAESKSKTSYREYRQKQRDRIRALAAERAIDAKLADEQEDQFQAAVGAELAAAEAVTAARQKEAASRAKVEQAKADLGYAEAEVVVAQASLERAQVLLGYTVIRSPYDGVVTRRSFSRGDFVRSADGGGERVPVLSVERTDVMRLVVQVPDRDVPYVSTGDPAHVDFDALPGIALEGAGDERVVISRAADSEDPLTRTMRTEIDLKNRDGYLRRGMFGRVTITLDTGSEKAFRVPSAALTGKAADGKGTVRLVRGGKVVAVPVKYGIDNGAEVELLSGVTAADAVVVRANGPVDANTPVVEANAPAGRQ